MRHRRLHVLSFHRRPDPARGHGVVRHHRLPPISASGSGFPPLPDEEELWDESRGEEEQLLDKVSLYDDPHLEAYWAGWSRASTARDGRQPIHPLPDPRGRGPDLETPSPTRTARSTCTPAAGADGERGPARHRARSRDDARREPPHAALPARRPQQGDRSDRRRGRPPRWRWPSHGGCPRPRPLGGHAGGRDVLRL